MSNLIAITYDKAQDGWDAFNELANMQKMQILELEEDQFYIGQVLDFDGTLEPEVQGVNIGSYLRFREHHIFSSFAA